MFKINRLSIFAFLFTFANYLSALLVYQGQPATFALFRDNFKIADFVDVTQIELDPTLLSPGVYELRENVFEVLLDYRSFWVENGSIHEIWSAAASDSALPFNNPAPLLPATDSGAEWNPFDLVPDNFTPNGQDDKELEAFMKALAEIPQESFDFLNNTAPETYPTMLEKRHRDAALNDIYFDENGSVFGKFNFTLQAQPPLKKYKREAKDEKLEQHLSQILLDRGSLVGKVVATNEELFIDFCRKCPFELSSSQKEALSLIDKEFESGRPLSFILVGSVGFGKTEVAIRAAFKVALNHQVVFIAPTTTLAEQHFETLNNRFAGTGLEVVKIPKGYKSKPMLKKIESGEAKIIVGTQAVFGKNLKYKSIGLIIIDEEHRFGVQQKEKLRENFKDAHVLWMSATPIPRTLALMEEGLMKGYTMTTAPLGRQAVITQNMDFSEEDFKKVLAVELARGGQTFVVVPKIKSIEAVKAHLEKFFPELSIAFVHGQLAEKDKALALNDFKDGKTHILIATTLIEVGIDIPNANTMIIVDPHRLGMATLSQLRGRVGRNSTQAYCYLVTALETKPCENLETIQRLQAFVQNSALGDDIELARKDKEIRGAGELTSKEQKGHRESSWKRKY